MRGAVAIALLVPVVQEVALTVRAWMKQRRKAQRDDRDTQIQQLEERLRDLEQRAEAEARWR